LVVVEKEGNTSFLRLERAIMAGWQGVSEDQTFVIKLTQSNTTLFSTNGIRVEICFRT